MESYWEGGRVTLNVGHLFFFGGAGETAQAGERDKGREGERERISVEPDMGLNLETTSS